MDDGPGYKRRKDDNDGGSGWEANNQQDQGPAKEVWGAATDAHKVNQTPHDQMMNQPPRWGQQQPESTPGYGQIQDQRYKDQN